MISDMLSKNVEIRINPIATELFIRNRKLFFFDNIFLFFCTRKY